MSLSPLPNSPTPSPKEPTYTSFASGPHSPTSVERKARISGASSTDTLEPHGGFSISSGFSCVCAEWMVSLYKYFKNLLRNICSCSCFGSRSVPASPNMDPPSPKPTTVALPASPTHPTSSTTVPMSPASSGDGVGFPSAETTANPSDDATANSQIEECKDEKKGREVDFEVAGLAKLSQAELQTQVDIFKARKQDQWKILLKIVRNADEQADPQRKVEKEFFKALIPDTQKQLYLEISNQEKTYKMLQANQNGGDVPENMEPNIVEGETLLHNNPYSHPLISNALSVLAELE